MIKGFTEETAPLTDYEREHVLPAILGLFQSRVGSESAITNKGIIHALPPSLQVGEPRVRKVINHIRNNDLIPCLLASSKGYWIASSEAEVLAYEESLLGREEAIRADRMAISRQRMLVYGIPVQGVLFE